MESSFNPSDNQDSGNHHNNFESSDRNEDSSRHEHFAASVNDDVPHSDVNPLYTTELSPNDILFGRGAPTFRHPGNVKFREIVMRRKAEYLASSRHEPKKRIAQEIIDEVTSPSNGSGRFLREVKTSSEARSLGIPPGTQAWILVGQDDINAKVKQALREGESGNGGFSFKSPCDLYDETLPALPGMITDSFGHESYFQAPFYNSNSPSIYYLNPPQIDDSSSATLQSGTHDTSMNMFVSNCTSIILQSLLEVINNPPQIVKSPEMLEFKLQENAHSIESFKEFTGTEHEIQVNLLKYQLQQLLHKLQEQLDTLHIPSAQLPDLLKQLQSNLTSINSNQSNLATPDQRKVLIADIHNSKTHFSLHSQIESPPLISNLTAPSYQIEFNPMPSAQSGYGATDIGNGQKPCEIEVNTMSPAQTGHGAAEITNGQCYVPKVTKVAPDSSYQQAHACLPEACQPQSVVQAVNTLNTLEQTLDISNARNILSQLGINLNQSSTTQGGDSTQQWSNLVDSLSTFLSTFMSTHQAGNSSCVATFPVANESVSGNLHNEHSYTNTFVRTGESKEQMSSRVESISSEDSQNQNRTETRKRKQYTGVSISSENISPRSRTSKFY